MKCPKCGYLGFETGDRCRNCGYDFSLAPTFAPSSLETSAGRAVDFTLDPGPESSRPSLDLDRIIGVPEADAAGDLPLFPPPHLEREERAPGVRRPHPFGAPDDAPLISAPAHPRAPLGVRRATAEVPRARPRTTRPAAAHEEPLFETVPVAVIGQAFDPRRSAVTSAGVPASPSSRIMAGLVDAALILAVDGVVVYFTLRLLGLSTSELFALPLLPLAGFFLLLNGGYFVAFTAVGGQSIGKMAFGLKVVGQEDGTVPIGQAALRTIAYIASALPLGAGFLQGIISADRLALHDRLAHTRVVRPS
ncbi:MAG: hypothetical protein EHM55_18275 [Acidobacteria bacterium]|nr:MAG: hypothetical protein EHM55_18275 [Acidobacteriota bacterium]